MTSAFLADLFPYLVAFYLADGLTIVRLRQALFSSAWRRHSRMGAGLHLLGLAPWAEVFMIDDDPVLLLPAGLGLFDLHARYSPALLELSDVELVPWEALGDVRAEGRRVVAGKRTLCLSATRTSARVLAGRIAAVLRAPAKQRVGEMERQLEAATDLVALRALRQTTRPLRRALAGVGLFLFAIVFLLLPAALYTPLAPHIPVGPLAVALLVAAAVAAVLGAALAVRGGMRGEVIQLVLPLLFFPPGGAHALAHLSRGLLARFDAAAVAADLLPRADFVRSARGELNRARLGRERASGTKLEPWFAGRERAWRRVIGALGLSPGDVLAAPSAVDADSRGYCPLCSTQYRVGFERCRECGVTLQALEVAG